MTIILKMLTSFAKTTPTRIAVSTYMLMWLYMAAQISVNSVACHVAVSFSLYRLITSDLHWQIHKNLLSYVG